MTGPKGEQGPPGATGNPGPPGELLGASIQPQGIQATRPQNDATNRNKRKRNKRLRKRKKRSVEPDDIDDDLDSVRSKLLARQETGGEVLVADVIQEVSTVMLNHIEGLKKELDYIRYPEGKRENPALSCREIKLGHPSYKTGWYWVDPNLGSIDDAIQVWCNMTETPETCVYPTQRTKMAKERFYEKQKKNKLFKFLKDGFEIRYASSIQMDFLRLLSEEATQRFTYYCSGSVAWMDSTTGDLENSISLVGSNDWEFETSEFSDKMVVHDGCKDRGQNGFTAFEIRTKKLGRLPIVNFRPKDYGEPWQKFGFEAGPICFH